MWKDRKQNIGFQKIVNRGNAYKIAEEKVSSKEKYDNQKINYLSKEDNIIHLTNSVEAEDDSGKDNLDAVTEITNKTETDSLAGVQDISSPDTLEAVSCEEKSIKDVARALSVLEELLKDEFARTTTELLAANWGGDFQLNNEESSFEKDDKQQQLNDDEEESPYVPSEYVISDEDDGSNESLELNLDLLEKELKREREKRRFIRLVISTFNGLVVTAAIAILVAMLWMPVLQIYGSSMTPALEEGNVVVAIKDTNFEAGDLVAFYYGNKLLVKRCIAGPADWIEIDNEGNVKVNGEKIEEPYVSEKSLGECDLEFPYQVPEEQWFLMGDHRKTSVDSRSDTIGTVSSEQIVGKVIMRVWPINEISWLQ